MKHSIAIAALVVATIGATALPVAAQDQTAPSAPAGVTAPPAAAPADATPAPASPAANAGDRDHRKMMQRDKRGDMRGMWGMGRGGVLGLVCSDKGAEALEVAFVRWSHRLDLTADQTKLFDALKTKALTTQTSFADECKTAMPATTADAKPDLLTALKARLAIQQAELTALNAVLPDFEAFYGSLTDAQKADLMPRMMRDGGGDRMGRGPSDDRSAPGRTHRMPAPGRY